MSAKSKDYRNNSNQFIQEIKACELGNKMPAAVSFKKYDTNLAIETEVVVPWQKAIEYLRKSPASKVHYIYWANKHGTHMDFGKNGRSWGEWYLYNGLYTITQAGHPVLIELSVETK